MVAASAQQINIEGVVYRRIRSVPKLKVPLNLASRRGDTSAVVRQLRMLARQNSEEFSYGGRDNAVKLASRDTFSESFASVHKPVGIRFLLMARMRLCCCGGGCGAGCGGVACASGVLRSQRRNSNVGLRVFQR